MASVVRQDLDPMSLLSLRNDSSCQKTTAQVLGGQGECLSTVRTESGSITVHRTTMLRGLFLQANISTSTRGLGKRRAPGPGAEIDAVSTQRPRTLEKQLLKSWVARAGA